ncbi:hypothetical protein NX794_35715 [Streptomyces sp. LP11]|uniref:Uncharacterized protein n=1 Tax=Streptomyces pyxinicus TaxID=2970331 RepID=A0ABT2BDJ1_9ACTN|nr:hypothetical protein [Streptomyces sp. LP11]MCS0606515.1 hypothetical protein [Streptomyces sp. LP11]
MNAKAMALTPVAMVAVVCLKSFTDATHPCASPSPISYCNQIIAESDRAGQRLEGDLRVL